MIYLNPEIVTWYKSNSQKARVMTEFWTWENIFCPNCWKNISQYNNNRPVADFYCNNCKEEYELKSWKWLGNKITDWAYYTMIERLRSTNNPNFFLLNYTLDYQIKNFIVIPKHYFTEEIIEKRNPLPVTARRAGWIWCNILLSPIPESWKIFYIKNWEKRNKEEILDRHQAALCRLSFGDARSHGAVWCERRGRNSQGGGRVPEGVPLAQAGSRLPVRASGPVPLAEVQSPQENAQSAFSFV